jgi:hypothetical protein
VQVRLRGRGVAPGGRDTGLLLPGPAGSPAAEIAADTVAVAADGSALPHEGREAG